MGRVTALATPADERPPVRAVVSPGPTLPPAVFGASDRGFGWVVTLAVTALAAATRLFMLNYPSNDGFLGSRAVQTPVFDEKHYAPQGWQVLDSGRWIEDNPGFGLIVHPPVGKWMIAIGEWLFGYGPMGWRVMSAVCGIGLVFLVVRAARRLSRSSLIGGLAGLFLVCDGLTMVSSRVALLDIFLVFFGFAAFSMILVDRDRMRERLHRAATEGRIDDSPYGPRLGFRWWRFSAALTVGLACGVKWSGLYFLIGILALSLAFDVANRRAYGVQKPWLGTLLRDVVPSGMSLAVTPVLVYLGTFWAWFASETAVFRYAVGNQVPTGGALSWLPDSLRSLIYYEQTILSFHDGLTNSAGNHHPWESKPWTWPMGLRPMLYHYTSDQAGGMCGDGPCVRAVMAVGTPALTWIAVPVVLWALWKMVVKHDWAYAAPVTMYFATYLPWFINLDRQMYYFYALTLMPFLCIMIALICREVMGLDGRSQYFGVERRQLGQWVVVLYTTLVVLNFAWLWPILTAAPIPVWWWRLELWLPSWQ